MTKCETCKYWDCDTGHCSMKMIIISSNGAKNIFFCGKNDEDLE